MSSHTYSYMASMTYTLSLTRGLRFESDLRLCTFLPIVYHCGHHAALFSAFLAGGTAIVGRRPDPVQTVATIRDERATAIWAGSPLLLRAIAEAAEADPTADLTSLTVAMFSLADDASRPRPAPEGAGGRGARAARGVRPDRGDELLPLLVRPVAGEGRGLARARSTTSARPNPLLAATDHGRRRHDPRPRRSRRGGLSLAGRDRRLLPGRSGHPRGVQARLVSLRRQLRLRARRPAGPGRPLQGHRQVRRRERLQRARRGRRDPAPGGRARGRDRDPARALGRDRRRRRRGRARTPNGPPTTS